MNNLNSFNVVRNGNRFFLIVVEFGGLLCFIVVKYLVRLGVIDFWIGNND